MVFVDQHVTDSDFEDDGIFLPEENVRHKRADNYVECESDQTVFLAELFALDRTVMKNPVKLWEKGSSKLRYSMRFLRIIRPNHCQTKNFSFKIPSYI